MHRMLLTQCCKGTTMEHVVEEAYTNDGRLVEHMKCNCTTVP